MSLDQILSNFPGARKCGSGWEARCLAHEDRSPSLSISQGEEGRILLKCHAGCSTEAILSKLGLEMADLFLAPKKTQTNSGGQKVVAATYDYRDEHKALLFQVLRYEPKGFSQRKPDGRGGWVYKLSGVRRVPFHLPELLAAKPEQIVFVVEGEKDVLALEVCGLVATTNPGGAGKWRDDYAGHFRGRRVVILPDNDDPGRAHTGQVARSLRGSAMGVKVLALPGLAAKGDVSDWLAAGHTAEELRALAEAAPEWQIPSASSETQTPEKKPSISVHRMADVQPERVEWLWQPRIPLRKLTIIEGDPGLGKSWMTCAVATAVAGGRGLPGMEPTAPRNVLMLSAEDGLADTIRPRLDSMGADVARIFAMDGALVLDEAGCVLLEDAIIEYAPAVVIIDPLVAYMGGEVDLHRANETRVIMARLARIAERHTCALVGVRHLSKGGASKAIYRGYGSIDITAAARSVLLVGADPDSPDVRGVVHIKSNLAKLADPVGYTLDHEGFRWTATSTLTAERILGAASDGEERASREEALSGGPRPATEVQHEARALGISERTLRRAREALGVRARKTGGHFGGGHQGWAWELPPAEGGQPRAEDVHTYDVGRLQANSTHNSSYVNGIAEGGQPHTAWPRSGEAGHLQPADAGDPYEEGEL